MGFGRVALGAALAVAATCAFAAAAVNVEPGNKGDGAGRAWVRTANVKGTSEKIDRGLKKVLFGWAEIPKAIGETTQESQNPIWGITGGTLMGASRAIPKTLSGSVDLVGIGIGGQEEGPVRSLPGRGAGMSQGAAGSAASTSASGADEPRR